MRMVTWGVLRVGFLTKKKKSHYLSTSNFCYVQMVQILNESLILSFTLDKK